MRFVVIALALLIASPAAALTFTQAEGFVFATDLGIRAFDGVTSAPEASLRTTPGFQIDTDLRVEETGSIGVIDPIRQFDGHVRITGTDVEYTGAPGRFSGETFVVTLDSVEISFTDSPVAELATSLQAISKQVHAAVSLSGSVLFGSELIPVSFTASNVLGTMQSGSQENVPLAILWQVNFRRDVFSFERQGVTYSGNLSLHGLVSVPEPGTALLFGLGLVGLATSRPAAATRRRAR